MTGDAAFRIVASRGSLVEGVPLPLRKEEGEGGCGVLGAISARRVRGRHLLCAMGRMRNRGNAKGGGIAAAGLDPAQMGVSADVLRDDYLIQVAYIDPGAREEVERKHLEPVYEIDQRATVPVRAGPGLAVAPPAVGRYFCRPRRDALARFAAEHRLEGLPPDAVADELVYRTSYALNRALYASLGEKRAFVLCHGKDLLVFKVVGYAEDVIESYGLEDLAAHVWIGHQRYPTKGRVWHPGGAHPFVGLHEALVHNGDFANYHSICEYLAERNIRPLFLTDTEVSVLLVDLWTRVYGYPLEYAVEALAPTTERDFALLPEERRKAYRAVQAAHIHGSPDGPWFFIIARSLTRQRRHELLGITDTSMLRPQVFALHGEPRPIGMIASERQAIRAFLESLAAEDPEVTPCAERQWVARGGSHTDGGAFVFALEPSAPFVEGAGTPTARQPSDGGATGERRLRCTDKFGRAVAATEPAAPSEAVRLFSAPPAAGDPLQGLTQKLDRRAVDGGEAPHRFRARVEAEIDRFLEGAPRLGEGGESAYRRIDRESHASLTTPPREGLVLAIDARGFAAEGPDALALVVARAARVGWPRIVVHAIRGQRFLGSGLGPGSEAVRIDLYGATGDYAGSGLDGAEVHIHGDAQDQVGQILKRGRLVVHGDVGQTLLYGAKGGDIYVLGSAAGRPLICAVGRPRAIVNGTCLDYLAESFMAGDPLTGGGFVVLNAIDVDGRGAIRDLPDPYPGGNLLSLASGGAVYVRDPGRKVGEDQLNGGRIEPFQPADWATILPYLEENARLFGIPVSRLLAVDGRTLPPGEVYRKVAPAPIRALEPVAFQIPTDGRKRR